jgi:hypothetical protein
VDEASEAVEERTQAYFGDSSMIPLFVQENYVRRMPQQAPPPRTAPKELQMHWVRMLETCAEAAESISAGDLVRGGTLASRSFPPFTPPLSASL